MSREMKNSGCCWIGEIPTTWDTTKIKYLLINGTDGIKIGPFGSAIKGKTMPDGPVKIYNQANVIAGNFDLVRHFISDESYLELKSYEIYPDDILFSMMGTIGKCCIMPSGKPKGIMDSHLLKARLNKKVNPKFFVYAYDKDNNEKTLEQLLYLSQGSIMSGLNSSIIKNTLIALPPLSEQDDIVAYLDATCAKIDEAILKHKQIIEKLEEYRKATITQAVTKGLDPNVKMKYSGVENIGMIPIHWKNPRLKFYCIIKNGSDPITDGKIPAYGSGKEPVKYCGEYKEGPAVLLGRKGTLDNPRFVEGKFWNVDTAMDAYSKNHYDPRYFYYTATIFDIKKYATNTAKPSMTQSDYYNMVIPLPPESEQKSIVEYIDSECSKIDEAILRHKQIIDKLEKYRKSIIYNAVTGKIDSRKDSEDEN